MKRRTFVKNGLVVCATPLVPFFIQNSWGKPLPDQQPQKPAWLVKLVHLNDERIKNHQKIQITDKNNPAYGGIPDGNEIVHVHAVTGFLQAGMCGLVSKESEYFNSKTLTAQLVLAANYLRKLQHADGTIDLFSTNFHSTPDLAFIVKWLTPGYRLLQRSSVPNKKTLLQPLTEFLQKAGKALTVGGIHTPNHRWVICSALAGLYTIWPEPAYRQRAETWLNEKIDMDADGQYEEKSSYIYSSLSDRVLLATARGFKKPELLEYVRKNLEMTLYYIHPNGEIVTEASGRQDKAIIGTLENYYYPCRYMAIHDRNGRFAAVCRLIEETAFPKTVGFLYYFLEDPTLWQELPPSAPLPTNYVKAFRPSGLLRIRRENYDASILLNNPVFFTMHKQNAVLQGIRLASAFFGKGQFTATNYREENGAYLLESNLEGPYYQPFPAAKIPGDGDWAKMPREQRAQSEVQKLKTSVAIREIEKGFELEIDIQGTDQVPLALELIFRPGGQFTGVQAHSDLPEVYFLKEGQGRYTLNGNHITFGPGNYQHKWVDIRGALPRTNAPTVFITGFTPFNRKIQLT
ncbi:hypothetical protein [Adhaeribacter rhizoryzae]|uniref:Heparinase n=1 Tax=Adhaeribacter rhizoryzae TaxID=2607907 RepID=A0A5M6D1C8_9BACT|nr:hypothetical protein [Adhaeribacter rhizoryzae]KAA5541308.1 hypothetical protein F0145_21130 [Adhaeribacter rhizoryzae]